MLTCFSVKKHRVSTSRVCAHQTKLVFLKKNAKYLYFSVLLLESFRISVYVISNAWKLQNQKMT